ncbi:sulfite exporter TauE/SafE family protein [Megalodesulfovibrio paquesii]
MLFQTANIEVSPFVPPLVACVISFFTSMGGVSGAFLLLPFQMSVLGYTSPSVSSTNQLFNIVAIPSGVLRYIREGRMVWPLTWIVVAGTLPGVLLGAVIRVAYLPDPSQFKAFAALVLLYIGWRLMRDLLRKGQAGQEKKSSEQRFQELARAHRERQAGAQGQPLPAACVKQFTWRVVCYEFYGEMHTAPTLGLLALAAIVGVVGGVYGIGGGAIIAPFLVSFYRLPVYTVAGAALMGTFVTSVAGVVFYQLIAPLYPQLSVAPDWKLGILFGLGGMVGMYLGALCQKHVPARRIKWMLSGLILFLALKYLGEFLM